MNMKILDPKIDLNLDVTAWKGMREDLEKEKSKKIKLSFLSRAMRMKVLAAEKVSVTDKGLEINMRKDKAPLSSEVTPLPETKQF